MLDGHTKVTSRNADKKDPSHTKRDTCNFDSAEHNTQRNDERKCKYHMGHTIAHK